jgi:hypothetical protein
MRRRGFPAYFAVSLEAFGPDAWTAFLQSLPIASQSTLDQGRAEWGKLQSAYGIMRMVGATSAIAWVVQGVLAGAVAVALAALWRSKTSFDLKAAALAVGTVMVVPYIFLYDLVILAVAIAFLLRASGEAGPTPGEMRVLAIAGLLIVIFPLVKAPTGLAATMVVAFLIIRRATLMPVRLGSSPLRA